MISGRNEGLASPARARPRHPQHAPGARAGRQFAAPTRLDLETTAIDGFMADALVASSAKSTGERRAICSGLRRLPIAGPSVVRADGFSRDTTGPGTGALAPSDHNDASQPFLDIGS